MLQLDELLEEAAGQIKPTFDLDDIAQRGKSKVRGRRVALAGFAAAIAIVAAVSVMNRPPQQSGVDVPVVVADAPSEPIEGPDREFESSSPRFITPELGSPARWHLPAIFDQPVVPKTEWPDAITSVVAETIEIRRAMPGSDTYFVGFDPVALDVCLIVTDESLARENVPSRSDGVKTRREAGAASSCRPVAEFGADRTFEGPNTLCCGSFGLLPRSVIEVERFRSDFGIPPSSDWIQTPLGVVLDPDGKTIGDTGAYRFDDGTSIGVTQNARSIAPPLADTAASFTLDGRPAQTSTGAALDFGIASCARVDDRIQASVIMFASGYPDELHLALIAQLDGAGGSLSVESGSYPLGVGSTVVPPTAIIEADSLRLYASSRGEDGLYEISANCGLDYLDARSAPALAARSKSTAPTALTPGASIGRLAIDAIDVDTVLVEGVGESELRTGPGHYPDSPLPGEAGNVGIAGLRATFGAPFFRLDELVAGDAIRIEFDGRWFWYRVTDQGDGAGSRVVTPDDVSVLEDFGDNRVTLTSTTPPYGNEQRIVVVAEWIGAPLAED